MKHALHNTMLSAADELLASVGLARQRVIGAPAVGGFLSGAIVGAIAALLLAPTTGDELIAKLGTRVKTLRDTLSKSLASGDDADDSTDKSNRSRTKQREYASAQG